MDDLIEFLRARLDEDEQAIAGLSDFNPVPHLWTGGAVTVMMHADRARKEIAAKRGVLNEFEHMRAEAKGNQDLPVGIWALALKSVLHRMAEAYDCHPDYREAWRL